MSLLAGGLLIIAQDLMDQWLKGPQHRGVGLSLAGIRTWLGLLQSLSHLPPGMVQAPGNRPDAHPITMGKTYSSIIFHRKHSSISISLLSLPLQQ
jgi:hypothetical protein